MLHRAFNNRRIAASAKSCPVRQPVGNYRPPTTWLESRLFGEVILIAEQFGWIAWRESVVLT